MTNSGNDRWRLVLSDGKHYAQSMLATQQNEMITSGELQELCLVSLTDYIVNIVQNKRWVLRRSSWTDVGISSGDAFVPVVMEVKNHPFLPNNTNTTAGCLSFFAARACGA